MKTRLFSFTLSAIVALMLLSLSPAWAGSAPTLKFNLTEPVTVGEATLPAGSYTAHLLETVSDTPVLVVEVENGPRVMIQLRRSGVVNQDETPHLSFSRTDAGLSFARVQFEGEPFSYVPLSH